MITGFLKKIFGSRNDRLIKQYSQTVVRINALEPAISQLSDEALKAKTDEFRSRHAKGESIRVFPISNWTELDVWQYIEREHVALPSLYYSHPRDVVERKGMLVPVTALTPARQGETVQLRDVRFRTVGDITCTCPVASLASSAAEVVIETLGSDISERGATRMDDRTSDASMENRKKEGYF